ncbi:site-specific integrase [Buttiauxella gaviniae]|uniref:site-specific integrase n=1 Tax=Buttiauxella gaviniae TaxID=82990 RepID=UPI003975F4D4
MLSLIDNCTTLPVLFGSIYYIRRLTLLKFGTQKKELRSLKHFYSFWLKKTGKTFDLSLYESQYDIAQFIPQLDLFFHYLLNKQHVISQESLDTIAYSGPFTHQIQSTNVAHLRAVVKFFTYLNQRYMNARYQHISGYELSKTREWNVQLLKEVISRFRRMSSTKNSMNSFRSMTQEQMLQLNNMLLPSSSAFIDQDSGTEYDSIVNTLNPFNSMFLQYRTFLMHRLLFNYGLRIGEVLLLMTESLGASQPDSNGKVHYLLSVQNIPDGVSDPRKEPIMLKNEHSSRIIELDEDDYHYLIIFVKAIRTQLFSPHSSQLDYGFLFTTDRGKCQPLTYDAVRKSYKKIDMAFISLYPHYRQGPAYSQLAKLTPHVGRHTWAFVTMTYIYNKLLNDELLLKKTYGVSGRVTGLLDAAAEQLRILGGWSILSKMPYKYARRFVANLANENNLSRIGNAYNNKTSVHNDKPLTGEVEYDPFI